MSRRIAIAGAIATVVCWTLAAGTAVAGERGCARAAATADDTTLQQAADAVICLVNGERTSRGLAPLRSSRQLARSARSHSRDMVARRYFSHISLGGTSPRQRVARSGYGRSSKVGETIAWGTGVLATPAELVRSFMTSPGHRRILLDRGYRDVGIGLVLGAPVADMGEGATLTLDFARR